MKIKIEIELDNVESIGKIITNFLNEDFKCINIERIIEKEKTIFESSDVKHEMDKIGRLREDRL